MKGCIFKRSLPSGRTTWGYSINAGKDQDGKRKQIYKSGFERRSQAAAAMRTVLVEKDQGRLVVPDPQTFAAFAANWLQEYGPRRCAPKTLERYRQLVAYLLPSIGSTRLQELSALTLERVLNHLKDSGGKSRRSRESRPLSAKTVRHIAGVASVMLKKAVKLKLIKTNPLDGVELPAIPRCEAQAIDSDKVKIYLEFARVHGLYELFAFAAATGCRRGEACALKWQDLDLERGLVRIGHSLEQTQNTLRLKCTKTERTRIISLPMSTVMILRSLREAQIEMRRLVGPDYRSDLDLVFCDSAGGYLKPDSVSAKASLIAKKAGLGKGVSLHTLRHSHASQLLSSGVSLPTVSKRLGHGDVYTTAKVYSHSLPSDDMAAAEIWDKRFEYSKTTNQQL